MKQLCLVMFVAAAAFVSSCSPLGQRAATVTGGAGSVAGGSEDVERVLAQAERAGTVPVGIAIQDGNFEDVNPATKKPVTISELMYFATEYLKVDYIFWGTQEPYYSEQVVPYLREHGISSK